MEKITEVGKDLWLAKANIDELHEQDVNPNSMSSSMFNQLTQNIKKRGTLEQLPYCVEINKETEIIGGHHRIRSARKAGLTSVYLLLDCSNLSRDDIVAKQLAHNNINGMVDAQLTLRLFNNIRDADAKIESYVDTKELMKQIATDAAKIKEICVDFDMKSVSLLFLPHQIDDIKKAMIETIKRLDGHEEKIWLAQQDQFNEFKETLNNIRKKDNIRNISFALHKMCMLAQDYLQNNEENESNGK